MAEQLQEAYPTPSPAMREEPFLLADLETISLRQQGYTEERTLEIAIRDDHGATFTHTERYTPVEGLTEIRDVPSLLRPYFDRSDARALTGFDKTGLKYDAQRTVTLSLSQYHGAALDFTFLYVVAYSDVPSGYLHAGRSGIGSRFLTRGSQRRVAAGQPSAVSFFAHGETLHVKVLHRVDGVPTLTPLAQVSTQDENSLMTYNFTLRDLAAMLEVDVENVIYVDFQLFLSSEPKDSVRYFHDTRHRAHERTFAFIGPMGEPEFLALTGTEEREAEFEGLFLQEADQYRKAATTLRRLHRAHTGAVSEEERDLVWDMAASPWVYVVEDGALREVTITEVDLGETLPHREPIGLQVTWRYADERRQRTFRRDPAVPHVRVFDSTFDQTFE